MNNTEANKMTLAELRQLPYLNVANAARVSGLPVSYLRKLIQAGKLPVIRSGRVFYIKMAELDDAITTLEG